MSRKRKPLLQLGAASSKLHKYGYSKEFHAADKKGKSALTTLVGNYSDSDGDDSPNEKEELAATAASSESVPVVTDASATAQQHAFHRNGHTATEPDKSPDMDDELKNFLSEIEAIPMPADGGGDQDSKADNSGQKSESKSFASQEAAAEASSPDNGKALLEDQTGQDSSSSSNKPKPQYSMFVKGASEFVHSPSSQDCEESSKKEEEGEKKSEEDIPEEPTTRWQLVQDEGSQYYYYWNTLTNEVTWEIPSEYTQYLLLHREYTEKLARLPPEVLKPYEEKKAREAEALASATNQSSSAAATSAGSHTQKEVYGPTARASPTPASATAEPAPSTSHRTQKKHKKEKKKRRHKRRHSESGSDSSDVDGHKEASKTPIYGPQLPLGKQPVTSSSVSSNSTSMSSAKPQLLSLVSYLSDDDENDKTEGEDEEKMNSVSGLHKNLTFPQNNSHINTSGVEEAAKDDLEAGVDHVTMTAKLHQDISKLSDISGETREGNNKGKQGSDLDLQLEGGDTNVASASQIVKKSEKPAKEVIDMFAEEATGSQGPAKNNKSVKNDNKSEKETSNGKGKHSNQSSHISSKDPSIAVGKATASSVISTSPSSAKSSAERKTAKGKDREEATNLLNIVGYGSDDEDQTTTTGKKEVKEQQTDVKLDENLISTKQPSSPSEPKKRKKEKKKHRQDDKDKSKEAQDISPPNILAGNLEKDIKARVEETLDKEISDIVIQTVSQGSLSTLACKISTETGETDKLSTSDLDKELKGLKRKALKPSSSADKETEKSQKAKGDSENVNRAKVQKLLTAEKSVKSEGGRDRVADDSAVKSEPMDVVKKGVNDQDDDEDIDFEDLDDLDRALEVALEKKKVELAKYEEQERKQQTHMGEETQDLEDRQTLGENAVLSSHNKAEKSLEHEEKLKAEVKDASELALSKLEFLDISTDNLSRLQILFIELQTRLHDWTAGGLSTVYFQEQLGVAQGLLEQYEQSAVPQGWACQWDRGNNRYYYRNLTTDRIQWDYPEEDTAGRPSAHKSSGDAGKSNDNAGKSRKEDVERKSSSSNKREKSHDRGGSVARGGGSEEEKERPSTKKGGGSSSSSRHRKREERDKDRGSNKHDKRREREGNSSSHRYRRKRRRRRDHSSSSDSSDEEGGGESATNNLAAGKSNSVTSSTSSRRHHRSHHHKTSKKKKKRRSEQRSRSPTVEIVASSDDKEGSDKDEPSVMVLEASPVNSSSVSTPRLLDADTDTAAALLKAIPQSTTTTAAASLEVIDGEPLVKNSTDDKVGSIEDKDVAGIGLNQDERKSHEEGEIAEEEEDEEDEQEEKKAEEEEAANPAVIYKPPQIVVPPQVLAAARQPELYVAAQPSSTMQAPSTSSVQAPPSSGSTFVPVQGQSSQVPSEEKGSAKAAEDAEKEARKKKKEKKLATGPSLMMKKKHMSSMVQKWQKVKKEVEKEDRAKEMRQAAIRKKIEELK